MLCNFLEAVIPPHPQPVFTFLGGRVPASPVQAAMCVCLAELGTQESINMDTPISGWSRLFFLLSWVENRSSSGYTGACWEGS